MNNNYYEKNNYEEFYNDWTDNSDNFRNRRNAGCCRENFEDNCCRERHEDKCREKRNDNCCRERHEDNCCREKHEDRCREKRNDNCCRENFFNDDFCCNSDFHCNDMTKSCKENQEFERRPLRRCDEDAIEREIDNLFRFILNELCDTEEDIDVISRAFVRLANLLIEDTCLERGEEQLICCVAKDLKALQVLIDKTIRDVKCLKKEVKCC